MTDKPPVGSTIDGFTVVDNEDNTQIFDPSGEPIHRSVSLMPATEVYGFIKGWRLGHDAGMFEGFARAKEADGHGGEE